jgi:formylglycine-generating enzyme required for sulfatase activity
MKQVYSFFTLFLLLGCKNTTSGFETPEGPITPDGYRPPTPTKENTENMVRNAIKNMVFIEGGSYMMGNVVCFTDKKDELVKKYQIQHIVCRGDEAPAHEVKLDSFYMNKFEISYYEYDLFTQTTNRPWIQYKILNPDWWGKSSSYESAKRRFSNKRTGEMPAAIDWFQASDYCQWLGAVTDLPIDLPTEAEWEYAARNQGQDVPYATDNGMQDIGRNYPDHDAGDRHAISSYPPNPLGLHHMTGNVAEWVQDWFDENYYQTSPIHDPQGPNTGTKKILRGGSGGSTPYYSHNFKRVGKDVDYTHNKEILKMFNFDEGAALFSHGARCTIHLSDPIDINNLKIDLSKPAPDRRKEWLATKDGRTANIE